MTNFKGKLEFEGDAQGAERRRAPRVDRVLDLKYRIKELPDEKTIIETLDKLLVAQSKDLSETGICLWTTQMLVPGSLLEVELPAPAEGGIFQVKARVVWCRPQGGGEYVRCRCGLEFVQLTPDAQDNLLRLVRGG